MIDGRARRRLPVIAGFSLATALSLLLTGAMPARAAFPGANGKIAFSRSQDDGWNVYVMNADGRGARRLTTNNQIYGEPAWSPDGKKIAFQGNPGEKPACCALYVMNADGGGVRLLVPEGGSSPTWSPDGSRIAFTKISNRTIYLVDANGGAQKPLTGGYDPAWSPDGSRIAFTRITDEVGGVAHWEIFVINLDGGRIIQLTNDPTRSSIEPAWSADGKKVAFAGYRSRRVDVYVMSADGSGQRRVTASQIDTNLHTVSPTWSPDGSKISFARLRGNDFGIYVVNLEGSQLVRLSPEPAYDVDPDWQPLPQTKPPVTPPKPPVTPPPKQPVGPKGLSAKFDWKMAPRFVDPDPGGEHVIGSFAPDGRLPVNPRNGWQVDFDGRSSRGEVVANGCSWTFGDGERRGSGPCEASHWFRKEGAYTVTLTVKDRRGRTDSVSRKVVVQDWLIVSIGDSIASGEGAPDVPAGRSAEWQNETCHRSHLAGPAQAALQVEKADDRTSVTFVHVACSGATVNDLLGPFAFKGQQPQLEAVKQLVGEREIDALLISVGANDVGFGTIVEDCLLGNCIVPAPLNPFYAPDKFDTKIRLLPGGYALLAPCIQKKTDRVKNLTCGLEQGSLDLPAARIYIAQYHDPTRDDDGSICSELLTKAEWLWARGTMLERLNGEVNAAARKYGWNYVSGIFQQFKGHGYCAEDHWVVRITESLRRQLELPNSLSIRELTKLINASGAMHPNRRGYQVFADQIYGALRSDFYPAGITRQPR